MKTTTIILWVLLVGNSAYSQDNENEVNIATASDCTGITPVLDVGTKQCRARQASDCTDFTPVLDVGTKQCRAPNFFPRSINIGDETDQLSRFLCVIKYSKIIAQENFKKPVTVRKEFTTNFCNIESVFPTNHITYEVSEFNDDFNNYAKVNVWMRNSSNNPLSYYLEYSQSSEGIYTLKIIDFFMNQGVERKFVSVDTEGNSFIKKIFLIWLENTNSSDYINAVFLEPHQNNKITTSKGGIQYSAKLEGIEYAGELKYIWNSEYLLENDTCYSLSNTSYNLNNESYSLISKTSQKLKQEGEHMENGFVYLGPDSPLPLYSQPSSLQDGQTIKTEDGVEYTVKITASRIESDLTTVEKNKCSFTDEGIQDSDYYSLEPASLENIKTEKDVVRDSEPPLPNPTHSAHSQIKESFEEGKEDISCKLGSDRFGADLVSCDSLEANSSYCAVGLSSATASEMSWWNAYKSCRELSPGKWRIAMPCKLKNGSVPVSDLISKSSAKDLKIWSLGWNGDFYSDSLLTEKCVMMQKRDEGKWHYITEDCAQSRAVICEKYDES